MTKIFTISILVVNLLVPGMLCVGPQPFKQHEDESESFFENLVKTDKLAYTIWNITKQYNISLSTEKCITELENNSKLISFRIVNISLEETATLLNYYARYDIYYKGNSLTHGYVMYQNRSQVAVDQQLYITTAKRIMETGKENIRDDSVCPPNFVSNCDCISKYYFDEFEKDLAKFEVYNEYLWEFVIFGTYLDPTIRIIIMIVGLIANGVLLFIFINEETVRTEANILIFNLIINNVFILIFFLPANYISMYHMDNYSKTSILSAMEMLVVSANAVIILLINIQRYFDVSRLLNTEQNSKLTSTHRCIIYTTVTWLFSAAIAAFFLFIHPYNAAPFRILFYFLLYLFVFSILMAVFNSMTARKLQRSAEHGQTSAEFQNVTGSAVILHLTLVYYVTHLVYYIYTLFEEAMFYESGAGYYSQLSIRIVIFLLHLVYFSYPCINVLALYKCSGTYRSFFNFYLFRCWYKPEEGQYVTMNSGGNSDAQRLFA